MTTKIIFTSKENLKNKYHTSFLKIEVLFGKLIAADKLKGIDTSFVYIDDASSAKKAGLDKALTVNEKNCKTAFDTIYKKFKPDYMVIFGAQDIFPFQSLANDLHTEQSQDDPDTIVPSDLPYACDTPYSTKVSAFTNPTRVVGRIPDMPGIADMKYVQVLINNIIRQKPLEPSAYDAYFSVTADVWKKSTATTISNIFGDNAGMLKSPPSRGKGYGKSQLGALSHFFNCHGAANDVNYYGQKSSIYPRSLRSSDLNDTLSFGTVAVAECCYGAQLLNPDENGRSIASNYLFNNAVTFMGSSTIAYGPASGQGLADLICQYFLINVRAGASTGRALLEARQRFLTESGPYLDPFEMKTLAQFHILGDPSLTLVKTAASKEAGNSTANRRINLFTKGMSLGESMAPAIKTDKFEKSVHHAAIAAIQKEAGMEGDIAEQVFDTAISPAQGKNALQKSFPGIAPRFRTYQYQQGSNRNMIDIKALVIKENDEEVLGWRVYVSR